MALLSLLALLPRWGAAQQLPMLQAKGVQIVDAHGKAMLLRGCNVGGWLLQESYIIKTDTLGSQGRIKRGLLRTMPEAEMEEFYRKYRAGYVTKADIDFMGAQGFNCVRLPFHYDLFLTAAQRSARTKALRDPSQTDAYVQSLSTWYDANELFADSQTLDGFRLIDQVLSWCAANKMYVILDLHAAPGGQGTDPNINDNLLPLDLWKRHDAKGRLIYQDITVRLWEKLSARYRTDGRVAMYDFINEPHNLNVEHDLSADNTELHGLYARLIAAVRAQNDQHLLLLEGNGYGNEYTHLTPDQFPASSRANLVYNGHRYWCTNNPKATDLNPNQVNLIANLAAFRDRWRVPVWVGETGENSNEWFRAARQGLEAQGIGWCHWTLKRVDGRTSLLNARPYGSILTPEGRARLLLNVAFANCQPNRDVLAALTQPVLAHAPFKVLRLPGTVPLADYDLGRAGTAYQDSYSERTDFHNHTPINEGGVYRNDGVDLDSITDSGTRGVAVGHLAAGEWLNYTLTVAQAGAYKVQLRAANGSATAAKLLLKLDGAAVATLAVPGTGGPNKWDTFSTSASLPAGRHTVQLYVEQPAAELAWLRFTPVAKAPASRKPAATQKAQSGASSK
ncbi:cellulase family glycosylhydrolase [Hymenobacter sp. BT770]|uniref:cellulase family glycosylhydrolase n=1 Tax=Hymenobacter sp. BT770 TaxID=2886942 RepID=UPI0026717468|nr:cellulase family glycosylhydrolase [Hymenobacter sp. BT770]